METSFPPGSVTLSPGKTDITSPGLYGVSYVPSALLTVVSSDSAHVLPSPH